MQLDDNPIVQFLKDRERAKQLHDPAASFCALASVDSQGRPAVRTVVLWDAFAVITNSTSPKWQQFLLNPAFELCVVWTTIVRQYRVRGTAEELAPEELERFWHRTRYELKLLDHYYDRFEAQSERLGGVPDGSLQMLQRMNALKSEFPDPERVPMPGTALGIRLNPHEIDLWDGRTECPERALYTKHAEGWKCDSLVP